MSSPNDDHLQGIPLSEISRMPVRRGTPEPFGTYKRGFRGGMPNASASRRTERPTS